MQQISNPMANLYQSQLEMSRRCADAVFAGTERLDQLAIEAAHHAVDEQLRLAQMLAGGGSLADPGLAQNLMQRGPGEAINYQAEIMRTIAEMQTEIGRSIQDYMERISTPRGQGSPQPEQAPRRREAASEAALNPMTGMLSMWEAAFKEASTMATRNMAAARSGAQRMSEHVNGSGRKSGANGAEASASRRR